MWGGSGEDLGEHRWLEAWSEIDGNAHCDVKHNEFIMTSANCLHLMLLYLAGGCGRELQRCDLSGSSRH